MNAPIWEVSGRCSTCDAEYHNVPVTSRPKAKAQSANVRIWADTHYGNTGHHRFHLLLTEETSLDVAKLRDPSQLSLSDDPNYETMTLGRADD